MIAVAVVGLLIVSLIFALAGPNPKMSDYLDRIHYAMRLNAKWATRSMIGHGFLLACEFLIALYSAWWGVIVVSFGMAISIRQIWWLNRKRKEYLAKAQAWEDEEVAKTPVPDKPSEWL